MRRGALAWIAGVGVAACGGGHPTPAADAAVTAKQDAAASDIVELPACATATATAPLQCTSSWHGRSVAMFHGNRARLGWDAAEPALSPKAVASPQFGKLWESAPLDPAVIGGTTFPARLYASPLYADDLKITAAAYAGSTASVVFAATSTGWAYAIAATELACAKGCGVKPGTILWRSHVANAAVVPKLDGGIPLGVLATPVLDLQATPPRL